MFGLFPPPFSHPNRWGTVSHDGGRTGQIVYQGELQRTPSAPALLQAIERRFSLTLALDQTGSWLVSFVSESPLLAARLTSCWLFSNASSLDTNPSRFDSCGFSRAL